VTGKTSARILADAEVYMTMSSGTVEKPIYAEGALAS